MKRNWKTFGALVAMFLVMVCFLACNPTVTTSQTYTITYNLNGGTNNPENPSTYTSDSGKIKLKEPTREGYTFAGWYEEEDFSEDPVTAILKGSTGNKVFYAKWEVVVYTITYSLNGGTNNVDNPSTYTIESDKIELKEPTKEGYTFAGWYEKEDFSGSALTEIAKGSTGNKILYARWTQGVYSITYNLNGGENNSENPSEYTSESDTITLKEPTRDGHTFAGWYELADFSGNVVTKIEKGSKGNKTFYAKWDLNIVVYTITYNLDGGTNNIDNPSAYTRESDTITLKEPTREGYVFVGWYEKEDFSETPVTSISKGSTGNKIFYAKWKLEVVVYTITYNLNGGTNSDDNPFTYTSDSGKIKLKEPTREGYTFAGWYEEEDFSEDPVTAILKGSTGNKVFYAKWKVVVYTITYNLNYGINSDDNPSAYTIESDTITLKEPTREDGYRFAGWYETEDFSDSAVSEIEKGSTGHKIFYAKWDAIVYKITYNLNGGTNDVDNPSTYTVESNAVTLKGPVREGYTFAGWYETDECSGTALKLIPKGSMGDKILYAKWLTSISATSTDIAEKIASMKDLAGGTYIIKITGELTTTSSIKTALHTLNLNAPNVFIDLDLSDVKGLTNIEEFAFCVDYNGCKNLVSIELPDGVTSIGKAAFYNCTSLESIELPNGLTSIGESAFSNCSSLESIDLPDNLTSIEYAVFWGCTSLESINLPDGVKSIGSHAFTVCESLVSINLPDGVTSIGESAFGNCSSLESIELPDGVTSIEDSAFNGCESLESVTIKAVSPPLLGGSVFAFNASGRKIYVPEESVEAYKASKMGWSKYKDDIYPISD